MHSIQKIIKEHKQGKKVGIYSACSANSYVLQAVMEKAKKTNSVCLIEATSNQVNQYGGYTGMKPKDFYQFCLSLAEQIGLPENQMILGGDHLGPLTWTHLNESEAMEEAKGLVRDYVLAGFSKIHIDTSMRVADDSTEEALSTEVIARRGAILAKVCEEAYLELKKENSEAPHPVYVIGSEVPIPGGAQEEEEGIQVTKPEDFFATVDTFRKAFLEEGLDEAWKQVIAVVVQPGVEFGDATIHEYNRDAARNLTEQIKQFDQLVFEGHSTDYQSETGLGEMVEDGIAILKVGPALTFAAREAMFALAHMEEALLGNSNRSSHFIDVLDQAMMANPSNWKKHYHGSEEEAAFKRKYSFSDRCRYYLPEPSVDKALKIMIQNLKENQIPLSLLSAYMPVQYTKVRNKQLVLDPEELIKDRIVNVIDEYMNATHQDKIN